MFSIDQVYLRQARFACFPCAVADTSCPQNAPSGAIYFNQLTIFMYKDTEIFKNIEYCIRANTQRVVVIIIMYRN